MDRICILSNTLMDRIYILSHIYTSENSAQFKDTNLSEMYPSCAGTKEAIEAELERRIKAAKDEGLIVEEITSQEVHKGSYFDRVVRLQQKIGGPSILGISSVWYMTIKP